MANMKVASELKPAVVETINGLSELQIRELICLLEEDLRQMRQYVEALHSPFGGFCREFLSPLGSQLN